MKLSVLIPTLASRFQVLNTLLAYISKQTLDGVEFIIFPDEFVLSVGEKRNVLLARALGEFVVFFDDDDWIHPRYFEILSRVFRYKNIDYVGYRMARFFNGVQQLDEVRSIKYKRCFSDEYGSYRHVSHTNPIRREICARFQFPARSQGEDAEWCEQVFQSGLLRSEHFVNLPMYEQRFCESNSASRGTISRTETVGLNIPPSMPVTIIGT